MPLARQESSDSRVIAHIDMDCFYVQVEQRKQPNLRGLPTAVVQYNSWRGGGLIAVGYEARKYGVKRSMRGDEAKKVCPEIQLVQVPVAHGKADLSVYRNAGSEVVSILSRKGRCERASIDEVYLDLTEAVETMLVEQPPGKLESIDEEALQSHVLGLHSDEANTRDRVKDWFLMNDADHRDKLLACGALIVAELRLEVLKETEFTCSAGIAHNKMLAKLASGMNKPAQQTIVPFSSVKKLLEPLSIKKMKQLGGKLGTSLESDLDVHTVGDLLQFSEEKLQKHYGINTGTWLWNIARGICGEEVEGRLLPKSHGSGKTFPGPRALRTLSSVQKWLNALCEDLSERLLSDLEENKRIAHTLTLHASACKLNDSESLKKFPSKSCPLRYGITKILEDALSLFHAGLREYIGLYNVKTNRSNDCEWAITGLSVSASKIVAIPSGTHSIMKYFHNQDQPCNLTNEADGVFTQHVASLSSSGNRADVQLHTADPKIDTCEDKAETKQSMPSSYPNGDVTEVSKDSSFTTKSAENQDPSFFPVKLQKESFSEKNLVSSSSGSRPTESKMDFLKEGIGLDMKSERWQRKTNKEKRMPTILRFLQSYDSYSFPEQARCRTLEASEASSSTEIQATTEGFGLEQNELRRKEWSYKSDEIDPIVLNELPAEIQAEVRAWLRPQKRANTVKRGSSIVHYFLPNRKS